MASLTRLVEDGGTADALVDDAVGHLALAEAGHRIWAAIRL